MHPARNDAALRYHPWYTDGVTGDKTGICSSGNGCDAWTFRRYNFCGSVALYDIVTHGESVATVLS